jgi:hypothetical protein
LLKVLFVALLAVLVMLSPVFAQENQTAVLYPTDDAYVDMGATALNFGSAPQLEASWSSVQTAGLQNQLQIDRLAYLKFNLSIPEGSIIHSASLNLYVTEAIANSSILVALPVKDTTWTEATINGKHAPDIPSSEKEARDKGIDEVKITKLNTWYALNVTSYARSIRSGVLSIMVFGGNPKSPYTDMIQFYSKESPDQTLRPSLEVTYFSAGGGVGGPSIVYLTLQSSHFGGSVYVNGTQHEFPKNLEVVLDLPTGHYRIAASANISITDRASAIFQKWSDGSTENPREIVLKDSLTLKALYVESYYLNITTQYGTTAGNGWYRDGSSATATVLGDPGTNPPMVKADGILGMLGVSYVFDHWSGHSTASSMRVVVNDPVTLTAIWRQDYSLLYSNLIRGALSLGAGLVAAIVVRRRMSSAQQPIETLRSIRRAKPAPTPVLRTAASLASPTNPLPSKRAAEPARAPPSTRTVTPAPPTKRGAVGELADALAEVIRRRELMRDFGGDPAPIIASTTVTSAAPMGRTKFCRECGVKILRDSKYCEECGRKLV